MLLVRILHLLNHNHVIELRKIGVFKPLTFLSVVCSIVVLWTNMQMNNKPMYGIYMKCWIYTEARESGGILFGHKLSWILTKSEVH